MATGVGVSEACFFFRNCGPKVGALTAGFAGVVGIEAVFNFLPPTTAAVNSFISDPGLVLSGEESVVGVEGVRFFRALS